MSDVVIVRLSTGEEIVAQKKEGRYLHCAILIPNGQGGIGIHPWMPYVEGTQDDKGVLIKSENIVFENTPVGDLLQEYNTHFGSGIITLPKKQLII